VHHLGEEEEEEEGRKRRIYSYSTIL